MIGQSGASLGVHSDDATARAACRSSNYPHRTGLLTDAAPGQALTVCSRWASAVRRPAVKRWAVAAERRAPVGEAERNTRRPGVRAAADRHPHLPPTGSGGGSGRTWAARRRRQRRTGVRRTGAAPAPSSLGRRRGAGGGGGGGGSRAVAAGGEAPRRRTVYRGTLPARHGPTRSLRVFTEQVRECFCGVSECHSF